MAKPSKTAKLVVTSIVITLIVLAVFSLVFINFIVPAYQITEDQIYTVLTRLFPVLIGLILIQIGVMAAKKGEPEYKDTIDKLSPNAYDSSLYTEPKDDPMLRGKIDPEMFGQSSKPASAEIREVVKEVPVEVVKEVPVEVVREIEVPVEKIKEIQVPVEVIKEVPVEKIVEKEVIKEVPVEKIVEKEVIREVPIEVTKEVPVEIIKEIPVDRIVEKEVPVEVIKEVPVEKIIEKEIPVEVVKEVPVEVIKEVPIETETISAPVLLNFHEVLLEEINAACDMNYDLSLVAIKEREGLTEEAIEASFGEDTLVFSENGCFFALLPLYSKDEAELATEELSPRNVVTLSGSRVEPEELIKEASRF